MDRLTERGKSTIRINCDNCGAKGNCMIPNTCLCEITDRLATYEDAEEQGLLLRLPYPLGKTCYAISEYGNDDDPPYVEEMYFNYELLPLWGVEVFATHEEAEATLAERKAGE